MKSRSRKKSSSRHKSKERHRSSKSGKRLGKDRGEGRREKRKKQEREVTVGAKPKKSIEQLRLERMTREATERDKARLTLMGALNGGITE
jgi:hypothetical protein